MCHTETGRHTHHCVVQVLASARRSIFNWRHALNTDICRACRPASSNLVLGTLPVAMLARRRAPVGGLHREPRPARKHGSSNAHFVAASDRTRSGNAERRPNTLLPNLLPNRQVRVEMETDEERRFHQFSQTNRDILGENKTRRYVAHRISRPVP